MKNLINYYLSFIILTIATILVSAILSLFNISTSYDSVNLKNGELTQTMVTIKNMLSYDGIKSIITSLKSKSFLRLKIGISKANMDTKD